MSIGHARAMPSALALTVACTASLIAQESVPPAPPTEEKAEGTAAHVVAERAAKGELLPPGATFTSEGRVWTVDIDMHNGAKRYAAALGGYHTNLRLEDAVRITAIHPSDCWGTPDAWRAFEFKEWAKEVGEVIAGPFVNTGLEHVVRVGDYKYGHRFVDVFENWQLVAYGVGVLERLQLLDLNVLFEFVLVQPRGYHRDGPVRIWRVRASDIRVMVNHAFNRVAEAFGPMSTATTGEHCLDCTARNVCVVFRNTVANIVDYSGRPELMPLDATAMGHELRILDAALQRLEARRTGLAVAVESTIRAGARVPFYEMAPGRSALKWKDGVTPEEIAEFGDLIGMELRKPMAVMTPTQCVDAGMDEDTIKGEYAERPPAALKLKATNTTAATKAFGTVASK